MNIIRHLLLIALLWMNFFDSMYTARILGVLPLPGRSHFIVTSSLMKELAKRGHEVTVISPFPQNPPIANYTLVQVKDTLDVHGSGSMFAFGDLSPFIMMPIMWSMGESFCDHFLNQEAVLDIADSKKHHFDVVIVESFFHECFLGFAHIFKAPLISFSVFGGSSWVDEMVGNPRPFSHVADPFLSYDDHMTFCERLKNAIVSSFAIAGQHLYFYPKQDAAMRKYFKDPTLPYVADLARNTSLLFVNNHFSLGTPRPLVPNLVYVGGLHIKPPGKLPQNLQKLLDDAPNGVIYFSMGSNLKSAELPEEKRKSLLDAFAKLKQKVLWKWEEDSLPGQPKNVHLEKWLPQQDILAHKNVRIFITHGGLMSTQEAIYHGIPVVGIPVFGDQDMNMIRAETQGIGVRVQYSNLTEESISWAIQKILRNPSYMENAKRLSALFRDNPKSPMDTAVYWTEYVIKYRGAPHLRSAAMDLTWYQYFLLDVLAVLLGVVVLVLLVTGFIVRAVYRLLCGGNKNKKVKKNKKRD